MYKIAYDIFVIDTPPAKGPLTISAFKAMTHLVIPLEIELQAIEGLAGFYNYGNKKQCRDLHDFPLNLIGILPNKLHSRRGYGQRFISRFKKRIQVMEIILCLYKWLIRMNFPYAI